MQGRFQVETGQEFDVGSLESVESELQDIVGDKEPVDILARILAHIGYRLPGVKRIEKRLEGKDASSGIGSDLLAFASIIYLRNRETLNEASRIMRERATANQQPSPQGFPGNGVVPEPEIRIPA